MALGATIYKVDLQISDMDRGYYQNHKLTLAKHPSENEQRLMLRLLAFCYFADEQLQFGKGISTDDEPCLWRKSLSDEIEHWIELGTPDEKRLRKACARAQQVELISYGQRNVEVWWKTLAPIAADLAKLRVWSISDEDLAQLTELAERNLALQVMIQDGEAMLSSDNAGASVRLFNLD